MQTINVSRDDLKLSVAKLQQRQRHITFHIVIMVAVLLHAVHNGSTDK